jgi:Rrf2 family transcriptional regulator, iron-sulfur cluster assembly transcription factor
MGIVFSRQCEYALQAVSYLALQPEGKKTSIRDITHKLKIPYHFLAKIMQRLAKNGILISQKGQEGGFALASSPGDITLLRIVEAIDGYDFNRKCVMGFKECSENKPCAFHPHWKEIRKVIYSMLDSKSVAEAAELMKRPEYS